MAKIDKVTGFNLGQKIANPFKTSRNSTTNPFKYSNFEGNTLQFADVFEGFEQKKTGKLKIISSSVAGSMTKLRSFLPESITNFVNRVRDGISNAWEYAKNTNVSDLSSVKTFNRVMNTNISDLSGVKAFNNIMNADILDLGKGLGSSISGIGNNISNKMSFLNMDVTDIGKGLSESWNSLISSIHTNKITKDTTVDELKTMWLNEISLESTKNAGQKTNSGKLERLVA